MSQRKHFLLGIASLLLLCLPRLSAQTLQVIDIAGHSTTIRSAQIAGLPHITVNVRNHNAPAQFEGVPLAALLSTAGIQLGEELKGPLMTEVLLVEAADGYKAIFTLEEIDPAFATREVILADKRDGKPLDAREGPFRIVAPGDKKGARWVRQVISLRIAAVK